MRRLSRLAVVPLEDRSLPATFAAVGPDLLLDGFTAGEAVEIENTGPSTLEITLTSGSDGWSGSDGTPAGVSGDGSATLTVDTAAFTRGVRFDDTDGGRAKVTFLAGKYVNSFTAGGSGLFDFVFLDGSLTFAEPLSLRTNGGNVTVNGSVEVAGDVAIDAGVGRVLAYAPVTTAAAEVSGGITVSGREVRLETGSSLITGAATSRSGDVRVMGTESARFGGSVYAKTGPAVASEGDAKSGTLSITSTAGNLIIAGFARQFATGKADAPSTSVSGDIEISVADRISTFDGGFTVPVDIGTAANLGALRLISGRDVVVTSLAELRVASIGASGSPRNFTVTVFNHDLSVDDFAGTAAGSGIRLAADGGTVRFTASGDVDIGDGILIIQAKEIDFAAGSAITGTGSVALATASGDLRLGGDSTAALDLSTGDLAALADTLASVRLSAPEKIVVAGDVAFASSVEVFGKWMSDEGGVLATDRDLVLRISAGVGSDTNDAPNPLDVSVGGILSVRSDSVPFSGVYLESHRSLRLGEVRIAGVGTQLRITTAGDLVSEVVSWLDEHVRLKAEGSVTIRDGISTSAFTHVIEAGGDVTLESRTGLSAGSSAIVVRITGGGELRTLSDGDQRLSNGDPNEPIATRRLDAGDGTLHLGGSFRLLGSDAINDRSSVALGGNLVLDGTEERVADLYLAGCAGAPATGGLLVPDDTFVDGSARVTNVGGAGDVWVDVSIGEYAYFIEDNPVAGTVWVVRGDPYFAGELAADVVLLNGTATFSAVASGTGSVTVRAGAQFSVAANYPGTPAPTGLRTGTLSLSPGSTFAAKLTGPVAGVPLFDVAGLVRLDGASLSLSGTDFLPAVGAELALIRNDGIDAVHGTFAGLAEGATVATDGPGVRYGISYAGGDGNDVVLFVKSLGVVSIDASDVPLRNTPIDEAVVVFNRPIDPDSFTPDDLILSRRNTADVKLSGITIIPAGGNTYRVTGLAPFTAGDAEYTLLINAANVTTPDGEPGAGWGRSLAWAVDLTPPVVELSAIPPTNDPTPTLTFRAYDRYALPATVAVSIDVDRNADGDWDDAGERDFATRSFADGSGVTTVTLPALPDGTYAVRARVTDLIGIEGTSETRNLVIETREPMLVAGIAPSTAGIFGVSVATATGSPFVADGTIAYIDIDLNGDGDFTDAGEPAFAQAGLTQGKRWITLATSPLDEGITYSVRARLITARGQVVVATPELGVSQFQIVRVEGRNLTIRREGDRTEVTDGGTEIASLAPDTALVVVGSASKSGSLRFDLTSGPLPAPAYFQWLSNAEPATVVGSRVTLGRNLLSAGPLGDVRPALHFQYLSAVTLLGTVGADRLDATNYLSGVVIDGGAGNDTLIGGIGNDTLTGGPGSDLIDGGINGLDLFREAVNGSVVAKNSSYHSGGDTDSLHLVERLFLVGGGGPDSFDVGNWTLGGTIAGSGGDDVLVSTTNADAVLRNATFTRAGAAPISLSGIGRATITGGSGNNRLDASGFAGPVVLNGMGGNDTLIGGSGADTLTGGLGTDSLVGGGGDDILVESVAGNITLTNTSLRIAGVALDTYAGVERVSLTGGTGDDTFDVSGFSLPGTVAGGSGIDRIVASADAHMTLTNTLLARTNKQALVLSSIQRATLIGGAGNNILNAEGFNGGAVLVGGAGNDILIGGMGRDILIGGAGADSLAGGRGDDILIAGSTTHDTSAVNLELAHREWLRTDADYATRRNHLLGTQGGSLGGTVKLRVASPATVTGDGTARDTLAGGDGVDWFFAALSDTVIDLNAGETRTTTP